MIQTKTKVPQCLLFGRHCGAFNLYNGKRIKAIQTAKTAPELQSRLEQSLEQGSQMNL